MACRLCKQNNSLMKSHIFPEWLYTPLYDENHRFFVLSTNENKRRGTRPKGIYGKLLCSECEQQFSKWEGYARAVFYGDDRRIRREDYGKTFVLSGLRYTPFKLFQMSLIWRASIANRPEIPRINLGPHGERLRRMLLEERPGETYQYAAILMSLPKSQDQIMRELIYPQNSCREKSTVTQDTGLFLVVFFGCSLSQITRPIFVIRTCFLRTMGGFQSTRLGNLP